MKDAPHDLPVMPTIRQAIDTPQERKNRNDLVRRIQQADPYQDKRFAPVIANWVTRLDVTPEEHGEDVARFKTLRKRLKDLRVPAANTKRKQLVKELLSRNPDDFRDHYSTLQDWNRQASDILNPQRDLSDKGLPVVMRHEGYTMYRIDKEEHLLVPLVANAMGWCVTKLYFGEYGGPPYYPIVRDRDREPFCMVIPAHFDEDPDQAVRNANNDGRISPSDLKLIRPLVKRVLPLERHKHPYIRGVHGMRGGLPKYPTPSCVLDLIVDLALCLEEWPEGKQAVIRDPIYAYLYAKNVLKGPFLVGEQAISQDAYHSYLYARDVIGAPWPAVEPAIIRDPFWSYQYAREIIKGPFPAGERAISRDACYSYQYAVDVIKGPWPAGEPAISRDPEWARQYARDVIKGPFPAGEHAISQHLQWSHMYAQHVAKRTGPNTIADHQATTS